MATEPERPIEKLLREYASKRREQAGAPFEPTPARRDELLDEARKLSEPAKAEGVEREKVEGFGAKFGRPWRRWFGRRTEDQAGLSLFGKLGWAVAILAVVAGGAALLVPWLTENDTLLSYNTSASRSEPAERLAAPAPVAAPPAGTLKMPELATDGDKAKAKDALLVKAPVAKEELPTPAGNTRQPAPLNEPIANTDRAAASTPATAAVVTSPSSTIEPQKKAEAAAPARQYALADTLTGADNAPVRAWRASNTNQSGQGVLFAFDMELVGQQIRLVDSDGSVYAGSIVAPGTSTGTRAAAAAPPGALPAATDGPRRKADEKPAYATVSQPAPSFTFQVKGTNRTLNQIVLFNGVFFSPTNLAAPNAGLSGWSGGGGGGGAGFGGTQSAVAPGASISGKLSIGGSNEVNLDATRLR